MIRRIAAGFLLAYVLGFAIFMLSLGRPLEGRKTDAIVVPTGGAGRIDRGLALIQQHAAKRMLVTGADPDVKPAELAAEYKVPKALFDCCIDLGHEAVDTRSNADETAAWVHAQHFRSVRLVTSDWHMPRARLELRHALHKDVELYGDPVPSHPRLTMLIQEYNKYLVRSVALLVGFGQ